jgi:hypothetical protein
MSNPNNNRRANRRVTGDMDAAELERLSPDQLTERQLRIALRHARDIAEAERRARQRAEESARRAWQLATWLRPSGLAAK